MQEIETAQTFWARVQHCAAVLALELPKVTLKFPPRWPMYMLGDGRMLILRLHECDETTEPHIRRNGGEVNIVVENEHLLPNDIELFFGPCDEFDTTILVPPGTSWAHILAKLGCFPSVSQARKNGWNKQIDPGWTDRFKVGKAGRKFFWALNPLKSDDQ